MAKTPVFPMLPLYEGPVLNMQDVRACLVGDLPLEEMFARMTDADSGEPVSPESARLAADLGNKLGIFPKRVEN
jgi:hypothetical protein